MKFTKLFLALGAVAALSFSAHAQISVTVASGAGPFDFATTPTVANFATRQTGTSADTYTTTAALDAAVVANTVASTFVTALGTSGTLPPSANEIARHNTAAAGQFLQTRPTNVDYNALLAILRNDEVNAITSFTVTYDFGAPVVGVGETMPGQRVFFSATGAAGSWIFVPALSGLNAATPGLSANVSGFSWQGGANAYLLWIDDNVNGGTEGAYTIDNLAISSVSTVVEPVTIAITSPTEGQDIVEFSVATVTTTTTGPITDVDFYVDGVFFVNDNAAPFGGTIDLAVTPLPVGPHTLYAVANPSGTPVTSTTINFDIIANTAPSITITNLANGTNFLVGTMIPMQALVTDDAAGVTNIDWFVDGNLLIKRLAANATYLNSLAGTHTLHAVATDRGGLSTMSATVTVTVTNPPANFTLLVTNGSEWAYSNLGAEPGLDSGLRYYDYFYDTNNVPLDWFSGVGEIGGGDAANGYPETTTINIGPAATRHTAIYFRKSFNVVSAAAFPNVVLRLLRDDGAVVYLNGSPVWTNNMTPTALPVPYGDLALDAGDDGTVYQVVNISQITGPAVLIDGLNVVAVEVHQVNATSSDVSFDLMIWGEAATAPTVVITAPTNGQNIALCDNITINATASTFVNNVDFYVDNVLVGSDNTTPYSFVYSGATLGAHSIHAVATDIFTFTGNSAPVSITVVPNQPPVVTFTNSYSGTDTGLVFLVGSAITCQFSVSDPDSALASVEFLVNNLVILSTNVAYGELTVGDALAGNPTYTVRATDNCGNIVSASRSFTITNPPVLIVVSNGSSWKYFNSNTAPPNDVDGDSWFEGDFDDGLWASGFAELGGGDAVLPPSATTVPERTLLDIGPAGNRHIAVYFRYTFNVSTPSDFGALSVLSMQDDGAVVYLNGAIVATFNMPIQASYVYGDFANNAVNVPAESTFNRSNITASLITGLNTVAVEVHQNAIGSSDIGFDLMLHAAAPAGPTLNIANNGNGTVTLSVGAGVSGTLISTTDISLPRASWFVEGPISDVTPVTQPTSGTAKFYAVRIP